MKVSAGINPLLSLPRSSVGVRACVLVLIPSPMDTFIALSAACHPANCRSSSCSPLFSWASFFLSPSSMGLSSGMSSSLGVIGGRLPSPSDILSQPSGSSSEWSGPRLLTSPSQAPHECTAADGAPDRGGRTIAESIPAAMHGC